MGPTPSLWRLCASDLALIVGLWTLDAAVDDAKGRAAALKKSVNDADARIAELTAEIERIAVQVGQAVKQEAEVNVELEKYIRPNAAHSGAVGWSSSRRLHHCGEAAGAVQGPRESARGQ